MQVEAQATPQQGFAKPQVSDFKSLTDVAKQPSDLNFLNLSAVFSPASTTRPKC